jgi:hypothetical protein
MFEALKGSVILMGIVIGLALYISLTETMVSAMGFPVAAVIQLTTLLAILAGMRDNN